VKLEVVVRGPLRGQGAACEAVLRALPDWFGIEESIREYVSDVDDLPTFVAADGEHVVGLLALTLHSPQAAEIHVMGVLTGWQRGGVGRALLAAAERWLRERGAAYLTVKTLSATVSDPSYAATRAFYAAMGFVPLMELPRLWGPENPCLLMLKTL
jgi:GNAT superfamily N-acetyltransferase